MMGFMSGGWIDRLGRLVIQGSCDTQGMVMFTGRRLSRSEHYDGVLRIICASKIFIMLQFERSSLTSSYPLLRVEGPFALLEAPVLEPIAISFGFSPDPFVCFAVVGLRQ